MGARIRRYPLAAAFVTAALLLILLIVVQNVRKQAPGGVTPVGCSKVVLDGNDHDRLVSTGLRNTGNGPEDLKQELFGASFDPRIAQALNNASPQGKQDPVTNWRQLTNADHTCFNTRGQAVIKRVIQSYTAAQVTTGEAPHSGANTGASPTGSRDLVQSVGPIAGPWAAIEVTWADKSRTWILYRCGNVVSATSIAGIPQVPAVENHTNTGTTTGGNTPGGHSGPPPSGPPTSHTGKCAHQTGPYCGTPDSGPEYLGPQNNQDNYTGPSQEGAIHKAQQPGSGGDLSGQNATKYGTDTQSYQGNPTAQTGGDTKTGATGGSGQITNPVTTAPDPGQSATGDPCGGDPNCGH